MSEYTLALDTVAAIDQDPAARQGRPPGYLDQLAKSPELEHWQREVMATSRDAREWQDHILGECGTWSSVGECDGEDEHRFGRTLLCGREWCPGCGENDSPHHMRRFHRWVPKLQQMRRALQLVVTFPDEVRSSRLRTVKGLRDMQKLATGLLRDLGIKRALRRWHWFGDEKPGKVMRWHPHLNFLCDHGYFDELELFKQRLAEAVGVPCVIHAEYTENPAQIVHMAKYILRATFRRFEWDPEMAVALYGFRNTWAWGVWKDTPVWELESVQDELAGLDVGALQELERNVCPCCGAQVHWHGVKRTAALEPFIRAVYGAGFFQLGAPSDARTDHAAHAAGRPPEPASLVGLAAVHREIRSEPEPPRLPAVGDGAEDPSEATLAPPASMRTGDGETSCFIGEFVGSPSPACEIAGECKGGSGAVSEPTSCAPSSSS